MTKLNKSKSWYLKFWNKLSVHIEILIQNKSENFKVAIIIVLVSWIFVQLPIKSDLTWNILLWGAWIDIYELILLLGYHKKYLVPLRFCFRSVSDAKDKFSPAKKLLHGAKAPPGTRRSITITHLTLVILVQ